MVEYFKKTFEILKIFLNKDMLSTRTSLGSASLPSSPRKFTVYAAGCALKHFGYRADNMQHI